jgi:FKBP-type peptidyl-prolyl cis-trans isomerase (trigger factor)
MSSKITRQDNGTIEIHITFPWVDVKSAYGKEVEKEVAETEIQGFRKGKAPRNLVEPKLDPSHLYAHAIESLLPKAYAAAVKEHGLKPILQPQIHLEKTEPNSDWQVLAQVCEIPTVTLPEYKTSIKNLKPAKEDERLFTVLEYLRLNSQVKVPDLLVEEEANHRLSALIENVTKLGMTTDAYLKAKNLTVEKLKSQTATEARTDLEVEFILDSIRTENKLDSRKSTLDYLLKLL